MDFFIHRKHRATLLLHMNNSDLEWQTMMNITNSRMAISLVTNPLRSGKGDNAIRIPTK